MLMFSWYPLMSGRVNYSLTGINNIPSDKIQNVTLYWVTIQGSVDNLCKKRKANKMYVVLFFILFFSFISHFFVNGWNPGVTS